MWAFSETVDGIGEVCRALGTPVTGGNVSLYNETEGRGIYPTPVIGMLGVIEDAKHVTTQWFKEAGDAIVALGVTRSELGASELLAAVAGAVRGAVPKLDLAAEIALQKACLKAIQEGLVRSAHDCAEGGLAVALAESCFSSYRRGAVGAEIDLTAHADASNLRDATALLFSESPSRIVLSLAPEALPQLQAIAAEHGVPCAVIGRVGGDRLQIACDGATILSDEIAALEAGWRNALPAQLDRAVQSAEE